jgi:NAD(P) transhydrogenase subunit alpha
MSETLSGTALIVGVLSEHDSHEHRVALDPSAVARLVDVGIHVVAEAGCGADASFPDQAYSAAGAKLATREEVIASSEVLASLAFPSPAVAKQLRAGQVVIGLLDPYNNLDAISELATRGVTLVAFELLPRTLSRAQAMDALSSQSSAAGYRAAIVAADKFDRYLPMMITASGTATPAKVIVLGAGVAGLQAIATAKRLGAVVTGYDVRPTSRSEVESLGARFFTSSIGEVAAQGGYARAMTATERASQEAELADALSAFDIIITTARVPGHTPPLLVSAETLKTLRPGSVCVDLGASDKGGNVFGSVDGVSLTTPEGVVVVGGGNLASDLPASASQMYGRNVGAVLTSIISDGVVSLDPADEVHRAIVVCHGGDVTSSPLREAMHLEPLPSPTPPKAQAE